MQCPHCLVHIHEEWQQMCESEVENMKWSQVRMTCPACEREIINLSYRDEDAIPPIGWTSRIIYPISVSRPVPPQVPDAIAKDFQEACLVLPYSPKASAALSRRCLQSVLRDKAGVTTENLAEGIGQVLSSGKLPTHLAEAIDAVRNIGNFAAHPTKSTNTGEIADVESEEAEWTLETLESLFDYYYVQPDLLQQKRKKLDAKLQELGKPPLK